MKNYAKRLDYFLILLLGSRLRELKSQLQEKMRTVREVHRKEAEIRYKLENEEFDDDEEEEWEGEEDTDEDDSNNDVEELSEAGDDEKSEKALENNGNIQFS